MVVKYFVCVGLCDAWFGFFERGIDINFVGEFKAVCLRQLFSLRVSRPFRLFAG